MFGEQSKVVEKAVKIADDSVGLESKENDNIGHFELDFSMFSEKDKSMHILICEKSAIKGNFRELKQFFKVCLVKGN